MPRCWFSAQKAGSGRQRTTSVQVLGSKKAGRHSRSGEAQASKHSKKTKYQSAQGAGNGDRLLAGFRAKQRKPRGEPGKALRVRAAAPRAPPEAPPVLLLCRGHRDGREAPSTAAEDSRTEPDSAGWRRERRPAWRWCWEVGAGRLLH